MTSPIPSPPDIVADALADLGAIVQRARDSGDVERMMADLERWKLRTTDELRRHVSASEAARFDRIALRPSWVHMESIDGPLARHRTFLESLLGQLRHESMRRQPPHTLVTAAPAARHSLKNLPVARSPEPEKNELSNSEALDRPRSSLNSWLEREARVRGRVWLVLATVLGLVLAGLALLH